MTSIEIDEVVTRFEGTPTEQIMRELKDESRFSLRDLLRIASLKGVRPFCHNPRDRFGVIDVIIKMGYASSRGYDLLRGTKRSSE